MFAGKNNRAGSSEITANPGEANGTSRAIPRRIVDGYLRRGAVVQTHRKIHRTAKSLRRTQRDVIDTHARWTVIVDNYSNRLAVVGTNTIRPVEISDIYQHGFVRLDSRVAANGDPKVEVCGGRVRRDCKWLVRVLDKIDARPARRSSHR